MKKQKQKQKKQKQKQKTLMDQSWEKCQTERWIER